jgi:hypothetical protein
VLLGGEFTLYWMPSKAVTATSKQLPISAAAEQNSRKQISQNPNPLSLSLSLSLSDTDYSSLIHFQNNFKASEASPKHHNFPRQQKDYQQKLQKLSLSLSLSLSQLNSTLKNSLSQLSFSQLSVCVCVFCLANAKRDSRKNPKDKIRERQKRETTPIGCNALL